MSFFHKIENIQDALPERFNCPFSYIPHPLCVIAAEMVQKYLKTQTDLLEELRAGKMFGVLLVKNQLGEIGFLAAFSGLIQGKNQLPYFVPPIYDLLNPHEHFKQEESKISAINSQISLLENDADLMTVKSLLADKTNEAECVLGEMKTRMNDDRLLREKLRSNQDLTQEEISRLNAESAFAKAEFKRLKTRYSQEVAVLQRRIDDKVLEINRLKQERKVRSAELQKFLFEKYLLLNARGELKNVYDIFAENNSVPPAGTGECAAPKLLQYAYKNGYTPLSVAEFWYGASPKKEIRRHGAFYPACHSKCEPILNFMLQGLPVEENPLLKNCDKQPEVLFQDDYILVVNKPEGMLSAKGKDRCHVSVEEWAQQQFANARIVHRLDMATSGILVIAKDEHSYKHLQRQFERRTVKKRYVALLDGKVAYNSGKIVLPLYPDISDRPRQMVHHSLGSYAETAYRVLGFDGKTTRVEFAPLTGRTHQLRVHSAHQDGLNVPILGDELYGRKSERLYLHAEYISFIHPKTEELVEFYCKAKF